MTDKVESFGAVAVSHVPNLLQPPDPNKALFGWAANAGRPVYHLVHQENWKNT